MPISIGKVSSDKRHALPTPRTAPEGEALQPRPERRGQDHAVARRIDSRAVWVSQCSQGIKARSCITPTQNGVTRLRSACTMPASCMRRVLDGEPRRAVRAISCFREDRLEIGNLRRLSDAAPLTGRADAARSMPLVHHAPGPSVPPADGPRPAAGETAARPGQSETVPGVLRKQLQPARGRGLQPSIFMGYRSDFVPTTAESICSYIRQPGRSLTPQSARTLPAENGRYVTVDYHTIISQEHSNDSRLGPSHPTSETNIRNPNHGCSSGHHSWTLFPKERGCLCDRRFYFPLPKRRVIHCRHITHPRAVRFSNRAIMRPHGLLPVR